MITFTLSVVIALLCFIGLAIGYFLGYRTGYVDGTEDAAGVQDEWEPRYMVGAHKATQAQSDRYTVIDTPVRDEHGDVVGQGRFEIRRG